jgi:hypothetical protein
MLGSVGGSLWILIDLENHHVIDYHLDSYLILELRIPFLHGRLSFLFILTSDKLFFP